MDVTRDDLRTRYQTADTTELLDLRRSGELTELALGALDEELATRGVDPHRVDPPVATVVVEKKRSRFMPVIAAILSLLQPGAGQLSSGRIRRGLAFFVASALLLLLWFLGVLFTSFWGWVTWNAANVGLRIWSGADAFLVARRAVPGHRWFERWYWLAPLALVYVISVSAVAASFGRIKTFTVASGSMEPTLVIGDEVMVDAWHYRKNEPARGDIVVIEAREHDQVLQKIDRIVGLGGESISMQDKVVFIDGRRLDESFTQHGDPRTYGVKFPRDNMTPLLLPQGTVYVMGDNRDHSYDSRMLGPIARENVVGRILYVLDSKDSSRIGWRPGSTAAP